MRALFIAFSLLFVVASCFCPQVLSAEMYEAAYPPWSGYWWPFSEGGLVTGLGYEGHPAPLEKYDYVTFGAYSGPATAFGRSFYYDPHAVEWAGMCFYWSAASIMEEEPDKDGIYGGVHFRVGDKKGILTALYHRILYNRYGINSPIDFHHILEEFIKGQRTPIIMNLGTSPEVWNYPVYRYETSSYQNANVLHFTTRIYYADDAVFPDTAGTVLSSSTYHYYFTLDDQGRVVESDWEGESVGNAPAYASEPLGLADYHDGLNVDLVRAIVRTEDDGYEPNNSFEEAQPLTTGSYHLLALDDDYFKIAMGSGDRLDIDLQPEDTGGFVGDFYNSQRQLVAHISPKIKFSFTAETAGSFFLKITSPDSYQYPGYFLTLQQSLQYQSIFPWTPSGSWWNGLALFDPNGGSGRTLISLINRDGVPQTSCTPGSAFVGQFSTTLEDCFKSRVSKDGYLRVDADFAPRGLQVTGYSNEMMLGANLVRGARASHKVVFPHITETHTDGWQTYIGVLNSCESDETVDVESYDDRGSVVALASFDLTRGQVIEWNGMYAAFLPPGAKSLSAEVKSGRNCLVGYTIFLNPAGGYKGRAFISLPLEEENELMLPHVACGSDWCTGVALMNSGNTAVAVKITAFESSGRQLGEADLNLKPNQNWVQSIESLFDDKGPCQNLASLRIRSANGQPIIGFALYGQKNGPCVAGSPLSAGNPSPIYLPHVASSNEWWTGIGLMHPGNEATAVSISLAGDDGQILETKNLTLAPNAHTAFTVRDLFSRQNEVNGRSVTISADSGLLSGMYLIGTTDGSTLMGDSLTP